MKNQSSPRLLCLLAFATSVFAAGAAQAQTTTNYSVGATCTGGGQLCNSIASVPISTNGVLQAQFMLGGVACSNVRIHFLVDGTEVAATGFVPPGGTSGQLNLGPVSPGAHTLGLQAEGQVGGCNIGTLAAWAGTAVVTTSGVALSTAPIPTLSEWGLVALALMLGALGASRFGSRFRKVR